MSKTVNTKCSIFLITAFLIIFVNFCSSAPVSVVENSFTHFISELNRNKCSLPKQVQLPFNTTKANNFEYLSSYLEICQKTESTKRNKEAVILCKEIFENVRNISCLKDIVLPDINVKLSEDVCKDIGAMKDSIPENDESLLKRLTDSFICGIMCDSEFEKACQVLLWSFEVQKSIASIVNPQEPEQHNVPEDVGDSNDNLKEDNAVEEGNSLQNGVNSENGKPNPEGAKDVNGVVGYDVMTETSLPHEMKENNEQILNEMANPSKKDTQEKAVPASPADLETKSVSKAESQDVSTGSLRTSSTFSQHMALTANSNTEMKPFGEQTKDESTVLNMSGQLQGSNIDQLAVKHDETVSGLPKGSNSDGATNEQTQADGVNTHNTKQIPDEKDNIAPGEHLQDNSNNPANPNIHVNGEDGPYSEMDPVTKETDQGGSVLDNNLLPHESENQKSPHDTIVSEQNHPNLVDTHPLNKHQGTVSNEEKLAEKTLTPNAGILTIKDTTQHQTIKETTRDKTTTITGVDIKADGPQTNSDLKNEGTQDKTKLTEITHDLITEEGSSNKVLNKKEPNVGQKTEEFDNTIPDTAGPAMPTNQKLPEKNQNAKTSVVNSGDASVIPSSLTTSTKTSVTLEKMEGAVDLLPPVDEESDHYGDLENTEDDYSRRDYDGFYEGSKTKESNPDIPSPVAVAREVISNPNEKPIEFPSRNSFGQDPNDIIGFPEEDGHFFFYFLSIILILMGGYLVFHNKQKIIALIVEGRHERNRRSPRVGYKKLETK